MSRANWALVAAILGSGMSFIDGSAVNVALPVIQRELHASAQDGQWVIESYSLFLSALLLIGGSLGDLFGRRAVYGAGIALFAIASLACAFAPGIGWLVFARSVQGIGAAMATPGSLALISASFEGEARGKAIGTWSGFSAMTAALGPVIGGWLVQFGSWRYVFLINAPLALVVLAILALRVDESRDADLARSIDIGGAAFATVGLGGLVYGLIDLQGGAAGWIPLGAIGLGFAGLVAFVAFERRARYPMMPLGVFASRTFSAANAYTFLLYAALGGSMYFIPFDLIYVQGYPPSAAGAALLPFIAIMFVCSRFSGGLVARIGARLPLAGGAGLAACGFATFALAGVGKPYLATFFPATVLLGLGGALFVAPLTTTVMGAIDQARAGLASGINNAVSRVAGLIAIAALGIVIANVFASQLPHALAREQISAGGRAVALRQSRALFAGTVPHDIASDGDRRAVLGATRSAFAAGFEAAMFASAVLALCAAMLALDSSFALYSEGTRKPT